MKPHVLQNLVPEDVSLFTRIRKVVEALPEIDLGKDDNHKPVELSCHMLARAISKRFPVSVRDGLYGDIYNHSWLQTANGNVIDPYPVATLGGPLLIDGYVARKFYKSSRNRYKGEFSKLPFTKSVKRITKEIDRTMTRMGI